MAAWQFLFSDSQTFCAPRFKPIAAATPPDFSRSCFGFNCIEGSLHSRPVALRSRQDGRERVPRSILLAASHRAVIEVRLARGRNRFASGAWPARYRGPLRANYAGRGDEGRPCRQMLVASTSRWSRRKCAKAIQARSSTRGMRGFNLCRKAGCRGCLRCDSSARRGPRAPLRPVGAPGPVDSGAAGTVLQASPPRVGQVTHVPLRSRRWLRDVCQRITSTLASKT